VLERAGCELWMHPDHAHVTRSAQDPERAFERRLEVARQSGVPEEPLRRWSESGRGRGYGIERIVEPDRPLVSGTEISTDLGTWLTYETPGHAPSHVCLFQPERRLLISGDHLLGRVSLYYDYGWTTDPAGEFLRSLDVVDELGARLCLAGHGRPFTDVRGHIEANRALVAERLAAVRAALAEEARTAFDVVPLVHGGQQLTALTANWWLSETLCYLRHLEVAGEAVRHPGEPERWELLRRAA
jgi:glyoxylase-like metal-dependent hydrolase (beta-lactamase superfamily II)